MTNLPFFQLIQVALGRRSGLDWIPDAGGWAQLYAMARKQALLGICYAAVQRLGETAREQVGNIPDGRLLHWSGLAAAIQQRNEVMESHCRLLQHRFAEDGLFSCLLKGQAVARYYGNLALFRQSGDIDLWVMPEGTAGERRKTVCDYCRTLPGYDSGNEGRQHTSYQFEGTDVEIHFTPGCLSSPAKDRRLQEWFEEQWPKCSANSVDGLCVPTVRFNLVYLMLHIFRHTLFEGVGLRQIMDYYFVTLASTGDDRKAALADIGALGMKGFAGGLVWVMREVMGLEREYFICRPDKWHGMLLLEIILEGGSFGRCGRDNISMEASAWRRVSRYFSRNARLAWRYPREVGSHFVRRCADLFEKLG